MRALLDTSMLLALFAAGHTHHDVASQWWCDNEQYGWASCPLTENGFVRIASQRNYQWHVPMPDAVVALALRRRQSGHEFWTEDLSIVDPKVFDHTRLIGPKQITDVYLLALAVARGGRFVTCDQRIPLSAVHGAADKHLVCLVDHKM